MAADWIKKAAEEIGKEVCRQLAEHGVSARLVFEGRFEKILARVVPQELAHDARALLEQAAAECEILHSIHPPKSGRQPNCAGLLRDLAARGRHQVPK